MTERSSRRTQYTRAAIKDAFLDLVAKGGWRRLSVTLLCRNSSRWWTLEMCTSMQGTSTAFRASRMASV